jgi:hypothetical protein
MLIPYSCHNKRNETHNDWMNGKVIFTLLFIPLIIFVPTLGADAANVNASSCSQSAVQSAINSASTGDTVNIPAGSCTWSSGISIPKSKRLTISGAGKNSTYISHTAVEGEVFNINYSGSRITAMHIYGLIVASGKGWRIDHCSFTSNGVKEMAIWVRDGSSHPEGLIDNNDFDDRRIMVDGIYTSDWYLNSTLWDGPLNLGSTSEYVYIEDNYFEVNDYGNCVDSQHSGNYVFRFNEVVDSDVYSHGPSYGVGRGQRKREIYFNTIRQQDKTGLDSAIKLQAGTGLVFNNTITGTWARPPVLQNQRDTQGGDDPCGGVCNGSNPCDGNKGGSGYWCRDQIGRGGDVTTWSKRTDYPNQSAMPLYAWSNTYGGVNKDFNGDPHIVHGRDFFTEEKGGIGVGPLANRPVTCSKNEAYWATDTGSWNSQGPDGVLYKCESPNTWQKYYEPYVYPHPMRGGVENIESPTGLRILE